MKGIIIAFSREEDGKNVKRALERNGYENLILCTSPSQALQEAALMEEGILICSVRLKDMHCSGLREYLPPAVELLVIGTEARLSECPPDMMTVAAPVRVFELVNTVRMMMGEKTSNVRSRKTRNGEDEKAVRQAKRLLMERNRLTEEAAHRYLQKRSMETGRTMGETARMVLLLYEND